MTSNSLGLNPSQLLQFQREREKLVKQSNKTVLTTTKSFILILLICAVPILIFYIVSRLEDMDKKKKQTDQRFLPVNICAVNIISGKKSCPPKGKKINRKPDETSSSSKSCPSGIPWAIDGQNSSALTTNCTTDTPCNCSIYKICPRYITVYFTNPERGYNVTKNTFYQTQKYNRVTSKSKTSIPDRPYLNPPIFTVNENLRCTVDFDQSHLVYPKACLKGVSALIIMDKDFDPTTIEGFDPLNPETFGTQRNQFSLGCVQKMNDDKNYLVIAGDKRYHFETKAKNVGELTGHNYFADISKASF